MALSTCSSFLLPSHLPPFPPLTSKLQGNPRLSFYLNPSVRTDTISLTTSSRSVQYRRRSLSTCMAFSPPESVTRKDPKLLVFDSEEDLLDSLAKYTTDLSKKFCTERGAFTVVFSGGSLIKSLRKLVEPPYSDLVDWGKWHVFWVDERVVPKDHPDSNYKLAFEEFLSKVQIPTGQIYAINDSLSAEAAADDYEICLKQLVNKGVLQLSSSTGFPRFDLMLLGMGPDGHIASLFPDHHLLRENHRWVSSINNSPKPPSDRITLTIPVINSSSYIALVVTGTGKADVVHRVFGNTISSPVLLPVQMIELDEGEFTWFTDKAASSKL